MSNSIYADTQTENVLGLIKQLNKNSELEASVNMSQKLTRDNYTNIVRYLISRAQHDQRDEDLVETNTLDIVYMYTKEQPNVYRISIKGTENINNIMSKVALRNNTSIFAILVNNYKTGSLNNVEAMHKIKDPSKYINMPEYDIRIRLAQELQLKDTEYDKLMNIPVTDQNNIIYRLKHRISYKIPIDKNTSIMVDLTDVNTSTKFSSNSKRQSYELEVEVVTDSPIKNTKTVYDALFNEIYLLQNVLQGSPLIMKTSNKKKVLDTMKTLLYDKQDQKRGDLPAMQSESLGSIHISALPTNYSVTDKADGERAFMMILDDNIYIINNNLQIKQIPVKKEYEKKLTEYNKTIIDGEYVYVAKANNYMFLGFDILYYKGTDIRKTPELASRLDKLNDVMTNLFGVTASRAQYSQKGNMDDILKYYRNIIKEYFKEMNTKLISKSTVIMNKLFLIPLGIYSHELFAYSKLMWDMYTGGEVNCPYMLDGLVYTGLIQIYTKTVADIKNKIFKWKPAEMNTIDFYVRFEKDPDTGKILNVFDNSLGKNLDEQLANKTAEEVIDNAELIDELEEYRAGNHVYRIGHLHVGSMKSGVEQPVLFREKDNLYLANFFVVDGEVRDENGVKIEDGMVIECSYDNDVMKEHAFRWKILRVRTDKTEMVRTHKRKYGNNERIADKVWDSIHSPFDITDIYLLANEDTFADHMKTVSERITVDDIAAQRRSDAYYQMQSNLMKEMRNYHNYIKTNLMHKYCGKRATIDGKYNGQEILDIGGGRGGDIARYFSSRAKSVTLIDPDAQGLFSTDDGAQSRYNKMKKKFQHMIFPLTLAVADGTATFDLESQEKIITNMSSTNRNTLANVFGKNGNANNYRKFDVINMQMSLHFMFRSDESLNNCCENFNRYLKHNGTLIITTIDGKLLHNELMKSSIFNRHYTTENGEKRLLFEYKKLYNDTNTAKTGLAVDFHMASFNEVGTYNTEFIVDPEFLINTMKNKCNMKLIETNTFGNQFETHRHFFDEVAPYEAKDDTNKFLKKAKTYYDQTNEINKNSFAFSSIHRYYIFQKI